MRSFSKLLGAAALALALCTSAANAALVLNLRFSDDSSSKTFTPADVGNSVTVNVWAKVTGTDGDFTNDGFAATAFAGYRVLSSKTGTGVTPLITASATTANFSGNGALNGTIQELTGDGILDIGGSSSAAAQIDTVATGGTDIKARAGIATFNTSAASEILLSTFTVSISAVSASATTDNQVVFALQIPSHQTLLANRPASWNQDSVSSFTTTTGTSGQAPTNYTAGTSVALLATVPEPAAATLLGLGSLSALLARRRRA